MTHKVWLLWALLTFQTAAAIAIPVAIEVVADAAEGTEFEVRIERIQRTGDSLGPSEVVKMKVGADLLVDVPVGELVRLRGAAPGLWAPDLVVSAGGPRPIWRFAATGVITGRLDVRQAERANGILRALFEPSPVPGASGRSAPTGDALCRMSPADRFTCRLPVGVHDLTLRRTGFGTARAWEVEVLKDETTDLGVLAMLEGASLVGVLRSELESGLDRVEVEIAAASPPGGGSAGLVRKERGKLRLAPDAKGFFATGGLEPGVYEVRAVGPGGASVEIGPVKVFGERETHVGQLTLSPPTTVSVVINPPVDPNGGLWHLAAKSVAPGGLVKTLGEGTANAEGAYTFERISEEVVTFVVSPQDRSAAIHRTLDMTAVEGEIRLDVRSYPLVGRVVSRDEPFETRLVFEQRDPRRRVTVRTDEDGRFATELPGEGEWLVSHRSLGTGIRGGKEIRRLEPIIVDSLRKNSVEIEVPSTRVSGRVVDEAGRPVRRGLVFAYHEDRRTPACRARLEQDGTFVLDGIRTGRYTFHAAHPMRGGKGVEVAVEQDVPRQITLELEAVADLEVEVRRPDGLPAAGALVSVYPEGGEKLHVGLREGLAGVDGVFRSPVPTSTRFVHLTVLAPGFAGRILLAPVEPGVPIVVPVADFGGTLQVAVQDGDFRLFHGGGRSFSNALTQWARLHGQSQAPDGSWTLPNMEVGDYRLCVAGGGPCTDGYLVPNGELQLTVP